MHEDGLAGREECVDSVMNFIRNQDPDIVCLQEFSLKGNEKIKDYLMSRWPLLCRGMLLRMK